MLDDLILAVKITGGLACLVIMLVLLLPPLLMLLDRFVEWSVGFWKGILHR